MLTLTPEETTLWKARLDEAQKAYHQLVSGQSARVVVDQNGERVEFTSARKADLYNYIASLQSALGLNSPIATLPGRPATFIF